MKKAETGKIRDYLLGRMADERELANFDELLFGDPQFADAVAVVREDLINRYILGELTGDDLADFERAAAASSELRGDIKLALEIRRIANKVPEKSPGILESILALLRRPAFGLGFAAILLVIVVGAILLSRPNDGGDSLAAVYSTERPVESRLAELPFAPLAVTRGDAGERNKNRLRIIENELLIAFEKDASASNSHRLAAFYITQRRFDDAIKLLEKTAESGRADKTALNDLGTAYLEKGIAADASTRLDFLSRANERFAESLKLDPDFLPALFNRALCLEQMRLPNEARLAWREYLTKDSTSGWADEARKRIERLENALPVSMNREEILERFLDSVRTRNEAVQWSLISETRELVSGVWLPDQLGRRFLEAKKNGDEAIAAESIGALKVIGELEKSRIADFFVSEMAAAYIAADESRLGRLRFAKSQMTAAYAMSTGGDNAQARGVFGKAATAFREAGVESEALVAEHWVAFSDIALKDLKSARARLVALTTTASDRRYRWFGGVVRYRMSALLYFEDRQWDSLQADLEAARVMNEIGDACGIRYIAADIAASYYGLGEIEMAIQQIGPAVFPRAGQYDSAKQTWRSRGDAALMLFRAGRRQTSLDFAAENVNYAEASGERQYFFESLEKVAFGQIATGKFQTASETLSRTETINAAIADERSRTLNSIQLTLLKADAERFAGRPDSAIAAYDAAAAMLAEFPDARSNEFRLRKGRLASLRTAGRLAEAKAELGALMSLIEKHGDEIESDDIRVGFMSSESEIWDIAIETAVDDGDWSSAFAIAERGKADSLRRRFSFAKARDATLESVRLRLPDEVVLVQFAVLPDKLGIWVFSRDKSRFVSRDISHDELARLTDAAQKAIVVEKSDAKIATYPLYENLIAPVSENLDANKQIVIVPDKFLFRVPFAALWNGEKYLIEDFTISTAPSTHVFVAATENAARFAPDAAERAGVIGDPAFTAQSHPTFARLAAAEQEAIAVARSYPDGSSIATGDSATRARFTQILEDSEVFHFAGHYVPNRFSPDSSKFLLAGGEFRVSELSKTRFRRMRLAVISACDSSSDRIFASEGPVGASRAFLAAGAPVVVSALWSIDSVASGELMTNFHQLRTKDSRSSAAALRESQMKMLRGSDERLRGPYFWAPFAVSGAFAKF